MSKEQGIQYNIVSVLNVQSEKVQLLQGYYLLTYNLFFILVTIHESLIVAPECSILRKCMLYCVYCAEILCLKIHTCELYIALTYADKQGVPNKVSVQCLKGQQHFCV